MHRIIDARGRSCPEPVLKTKEAISKYEENTIEVLVDAKVAVENIQRFVISQGYDMECSENQDGYSLMIKK